VIIVRVQTAQLVKQSITLNTKTDDMLIVSGGELLYHIGEVESWRTITESVSGKDYTVSEIDGEQRLVTATRSEHCDFDYYYSVSCNSLFANLQRTKRVIYLMYGLFLALLAVLSAALSRSITTPIYALVHKMSCSTEQVFRKKEAEEVLLQRKDEVGLLAETYQGMLDTIEELIDKNYVQQLTIKDTQYRALQAQLNPHFLYNTLDSIYWMAVDAQQKEIADMTLSMGKLLRESIKDSAEYDRLIPLEKELTNLQYYISIQKIRFGSDLAFQMQIAEDTLALQVPRMILQPLVENSIHYSVEMISGANTICIRSTNSRIMLKSVWKIPA